MESISKFSEKNNEGKNLYGNIANYGMMKQM